MKRVRVRYAPSPTGYLHIGGARSALYNYLFAKKNNGDFIVRLEDTDIERNIADGEKSQLEGLSWLGIDYDESPTNPNPKYGPYRQTERLNTYKKWVDTLVEKGYAYKCYCTEEELELARENEKQKGNIASKYDRKCLHASKEDIIKWEQEGRVPCIRVKLRDNYIIKFNDIVRGDVEFNNDDIGDWVIMKSNGIPTYNFAAVIDDHLMDITHVFRGEEHLSNTPKQLQIFEYLGWDKPTYGHMTLLTNEQGKKLSKRDPNIIQFIQQYRDLGYLPEAIFNFLLLLGWSPVGERELFTRAEAIDVFDEKRLSKSPSMFDVNKLKWLNNHYLRQLPKESFYQICQPFLASKYQNFADDWMSDVVSLFQEQLVCGADIVDLVAIFFEPTHLDEEAKTVLASPNASTVIKQFGELVSKETSFDAQTIKALIKALQQATNCRGKELFMPIRVAVSGQVHGVDLVSFIVLLGKEEVLRRISDL